MTFDALAAELATPRRYAPVDLKHDEKDPTKWVKPAELGVFTLATFKGNQRRLAALESSCGVGLDIEDTDFGFDDALGLVRERGLVAIVLTTLNHRPERPRIRVLIPYSRPVGKDEHERIWRHLGELVTNAGGAVDVGTKDATRLWFASAAVVGAEFRCELVAGAPLDVDEALSASPSSNSDAPEPRAGARSTQKGRGGGVHRGPTKPDGTPNRSNRAASSALRAARRARVAGRDSDAARDAWRDSLLDQTNTSPEAEWLRAKYAQGDGDRHARKTWAFAVKELDAHPHGGQTRADHDAEAQEYAERALLWWISQPWGAGPGVTDRRTMLGRLRRVRELGHRRIAYDVRSSAEAARVGTEAAWKSDRRHLDAGRFTLLFRAPRGGRRASVALLTDPACWGGRPPAQGEHYTDTCPVVFGVSPGRWLPSDSDLFHSGIGHFRAVPAFAGYVLDLLAMGSPSSIVDLAERTGADIATVAAALDRLMAVLPVGGRFRPRRDRSGLAVRLQQDEPQVLPVALIREDCGRYVIDVDGIRAALGLGAELGPEAVLRAGIEACARALKVDGTTLRRRARIEAERVAHRAAVAAQAELAGRDLAAEDSIKPRPPVVVAAPPVPVVEQVRELVEWFDGAGTVEDFAEQLGAAHGDVIRALLHMQDRGEVDAAIAEKVVRRQDGRPLTVPGPLVWRRVEVEQRVAPAAAVAAPPPVTAPHFDALAGRARMDAALARLRERQGAFDEARGRDESARSRPGAAPCERARA